MLKAGTRVFYLDLPLNVVRRLRQQASRNQRSVVAEAVVILEKALRPTKTQVLPLDGLTASDHCTANTLHLDLSTELIARLKPLAERNYRSVAGEAAQVLQTVLRQEEDVRDPMAPQPSEVRLERAAPARNGRDRSRKGK